MPRKTSHKKKGSHKKRTVKKSQKRSSQKKQKKNSQKTIAHKAHVKRQRARKASTKTQHAREVGHSSTSQKRSSKKKYLVAGVGSAAAILTAAGLYRQSLNSSKRNKDLSEEEWRDIKIEEEKAIDELKNILKTPVIDPIALQHHITLATTFSRQKNHKRILTLTDKAGINRKAVVDFINGARDDIPLNG